jgi:hypothetical protein
MNTNETLLEIKPYSDKSFAVFGDSRPIMEQFKKDGVYIGKFNKYLTYTTEPEIEKRAGWIFSNKHLENVQQIVDTYNETINPVVTAESLFISKEEELIETEQEPLF